MNRVKFLVCIEYGKIDIFFFYFSIEKNDNTKLRANVIALIEDNNRLHEEIRSTFVSDMLRLINMDDGQSMTDKEVQ